jgi:hypothetical protein
MSDHLEAFTRVAPQPLEAALLVRDRLLVAEVQTRLCAAGLLDAPPDGFFGPITQWALGEFCRASGLAFEGKLSGATAAALLRGDTPLSLRPGRDLAGQVVAALIRRGDLICRHPECVTIVYVEGLDGEGHRTARRPDAFDDLRLLLRIGPDGRPETLGAWEATTGAGRPAVESPAEIAGAPRLAPGQHHAWVIGRTAIGTKLEQDALVQAAPLSVTRDGDRDFHRGGDASETGHYLLDQHGALDAPRDKVGGVGAGCLVGRSQRGHEDFMAFLRRDPRLRAFSAHRFSTSIIGAEAVFE